MSIHSLPAVIALALKAILIVYAVKSTFRNHETRVFLILLGTLGLHNISEVLLLNYYARYGIDSVLLGFGYAYFATVIPFVALLLHLSLRFATAQKGPIYIYAFLYIPPLALEYLLLGTNTLVSGFKPFQFSVVRVAGPNYYLFETYFVMYLFAALASVVYATWKASPTSFLKARNRLWLVGLTPMASLMIYAVLSKIFPWPKLSSTFYVPIAQAFFLIVATYATYQYRLSIALFDIEFFIPWSKVRQRKTAFYARIQNTIAEVANLKSMREALDLLADTLHCQVALVGGLRPMAAVVMGQKRSQVTITHFPRAALSEINRIVVANEIAGSHQALYNLMREYHVGAIVPFAAHAGSSGNWMLLGEHFSENVYTPLDFRAVERLLNVFGDLFTDGMMLIRAQLTEAKAEVYDYRDRLALAWHQSAALAAELEKVKADNTQMRRERFYVVGAGGDILPPQVASGDLPMATYLAQWEEAMVREALRITDNDKTKAARLLGIKDQRTMDYLIVRYDLETDHS
jgi:hypothetical protein